MSFDSRLAKALDNREFLIRLAEEADRELIVTNINAVCAEEVYLHSNAFVLTPQWEEVLGSDPTRYLHKLLLVAEIEGHLVGHARIFGGGFGHKDWHVGEVGIAIAQPYRGIRIGKAMLTTAIEWAKTAEYEKLTAAVIDDNVPALELFFRLGFFQEGRRERQLKVRHKHHDEILLAKFLFERQS